MKIVHVIPNLGVGGAEKMLRELCRRLHSREFEMAVISLKSGGLTAEQLRRIPVPVTILNSPDGLFGGLLDLPRLYSELREALARFSPDIVHTWLTRANVIGRLAARGTSATCVISSLRVMESEKGYHLLAERWTHRWCNLVTVNCTALEKFAIEKIGIPSEKVRLIPNAIEVPASQNSTPKKKQARGDGLIQIGTMGRLHAQKGIDIFLRAAKIVLEHFPNCKFLVAGEGPELNALVQLAEKMGIRPQVDFVGLVAKSEDFLSQLDLFVLASRWEGMPNVVLEALAHKIPVVASAVGGVTDLIEDGREGLLVSPGDPFACAQKMLDLIRDSARREQMGRRAYEKIVEQFSLEKMVTAYRSLYETARL